MQQIRLCASDFIIDGENIWFVPLELPYLIKMNINSGEVIDKINIPVSSGMFLGFYEKIIKVGDLIVGIPYWAEQYFRFDIKKHQMDTIDTPNKLRDDMGVGYYATAVNENTFFSFVRFIQRNEKLSSLMMEVDLSEMHIKLKEVSEIDLSMGSPFDIAFRRSSIQIGSYLYMLSGISNKIIVYNFSNGHADTVPILEDGTRLTCIEAIDKNNLIFLLADNSNRIILLDFKKKKIEVISIDLKGFETASSEITVKREEHFSFAKKCGENIYLFPYFSNMILKFDIANKKVTPVFQDAIYAYNTDKYIQLDQYACGQFSEPHVYARKIYVWNIWKKEFLILDTSFEKFEKKDINIEIERKEASEIFGKIISKNNVVNEGESAFANLTNMMNYVVM